MADDRDRPRTALGMKRSLLENAASVVFLTLLVGYRFREGVLLKIVYSLGDIGSEFLPIRMAAAEAFRRLDFLLWSPEIMGGYPTYSHPHTAVFYPINWFLSLLLPSWATVNYFAVFHFLFIASSMLFFLRFLGLSSIPSILGAVVFALNGNRIYDSYLFLGPIAWLPLIVLFLEQWLAKRDLRYLLMAALLNGMEGVAGSPPMAFVINVGLLAYFAVRLLPPRRHSNVPSYSLAVLVFYLLSFGLMAVQALPTRELTLLSTRAAQSWDFITDGSLAPAELQQIVARRFTLYVGATSVAIALLGLFSRRHREMARVFGVLTVIAIVLCLGRYTPIYRVLFAYLPGFAKFRIPLRFFVWVTFGIAALAAIGLETLLDWLRRRARGRLLASAVAVMIAAAVILDYNRIQRYQYDPSGATPVADLRSPVEVAGLIKKSPGRYRVLGEDVDIWSPFAAKRQVLERDSPLLAGVESASGYMPLHYIPYMNMFNNLNQAVGEAKLRLATFMNIGYIVTDAHYPPGFPPDRLVFRATTPSGVRLFANPDALARVLISDSLLVEPDADRAFSMLVAGEWRPGSRLQVATPIPSVGRCRGPLQATVKRLLYGATRIEIDATTNCDAILCLRDNFYPGWQVTVDGRSTAMLRTDLIYRGVQLHPGENHVEFRYKPRWLALGVLLSVSTLAIILTGLIWVGRAPRLRKFPLAFQ